MNQAVCGWDSKIRLVFIKRDDTPHDDNADLALRENPVAMFSRPAGSAGEGEKL